MSRLVQELERLNAAVDKLDRAVRDRERRSHAELASARQALKARAERLALHVDGAIAKIESAIEQ